MPRKVLFIATVDFHFLAFHLPTFRWFQERGWEVHVACGGSSDGLGASFHPEQYRQIPHCDRRFQIPITRFPLTRQNLAAYRELKKIIAEGHYDLIHCHTPVGGVLGRLAAREARKKGCRGFETVHAMAKGERRARFPENLGDSDDLQRTQAVQPERCPILYTAHGFHFFKGAPLLNWMAYYPLERWLSRYTDVLVTITEEDFHLAKNHRFKAGRIAHVSGVGVDTAHYQPLSFLERGLFREMAGFRQEDLLLVYAAEFNQNKNQALLIQAMAALAASTCSAASRVHLLLAGKGPLLDSCRQLARKLGVSDQVRFLGQRQDLPDLLPLCDIAVASSLREGLPVNVMEAMACALPVVAVDNRGHRELVVEGETGYIVRAGDAEGMAKRLLALIQNSSCAKAMGRAGRERVMTHYDSRRVQAQLAALYQTACDPTVCDMALSNLNREEGQPLAGEFSHG